MSIGAELLNWRRRPYTLIFVIVCIAFAVQAAMQKKSEWTDVYVMTGHRLVAGDDIYPTGTPFVYPPFSALFTVPFTPLPRAISQALFTALNFGALALILTISWRLTGGVQRLEFGPNYRGRDHLIAILACLCALRSSFNTISHLQTDLVIAALIFVGCERLAHGKNIAAGIFLGLGTAFKATPMVFLGYLIWRRQWVTAAVMLATLIGASLAPDLIHRGGDGKPWAIHWVENYVKPLVSANHRMGSWNAGALNNQSLAGLAGRALLLKGTLTEDGVDFVEKDSMSPQTVKWFVYISYLLIIISACAAMRPWFGRLPREWCGDAPPPYPLEFSIVLLTILLISPMTSRTHFCTLLLPAFCLARAAVDHASRVAWATLVIATVLLLAATNVPFFHLWFKITLWMGFSTLAALSLLIGCLWLRFGIESTPIVAARSRVGEPPILPI